MHRTEGLYNSSNRFTDGPPGTRVEENWLNAIQEELCNFIEGEGIALLTADTDTHLQLQEAILGRTIESGTEMVFIQNSAPVGWTRNTARQDNSMLCYAAAGNITAGGGTNPQTAHTHTGPSHTHLHTHNHVILALPSAAMSIYDVDGIAATPTTSTFSGVGILTDTGSALKLAPGYAYSANPNPLHGSGATTSSGGTGATGANTAPYYQEVISAIKD